MVRTICPALFPVYEFSSTEIGLKEKEKEDTVQESVVINVSRTVDADTGLEVETGSVHSSYEGSKDSYDVNVSVRIRSSRHRNNSLDPGESV